MTNEELLNEYEIAITFYITATIAKKDKAVAEYEKRLQELKAEILSRMNK